jgi:chromosome segregation ATPase
LSEQHQSVLLKFLYQKVLHPLRETDNQKTTSSQMDVSFPHTTMSTAKTTNETFNPKLQQLHETIDILLGGIQVLNDEAQRLSSESLQYRNSLHSVSEDMSKIKIAVQETNTLVDAHSSNQLILEQDLASLQQQVNDLKNVSYDGTLIWKTTDIQQKIGLLRELRIISTERTILPAKEYSLAFTWHRKFISLLSEP